MLNLESPKSWEGLLKLKEVLLSPKKIPSRYPYQDFLYNEYLHLNTSESLKNNLMARIGNNKYVLVPNAFPYSLLLANLPCVVHCVLWFKHGLERDEITPILTNLCAPFKFFWYENSIATRSVPEISHVQVFVYCQDLALTSKFKIGL